MYSLRVLHIHKVESNQACTSKAIVLIHVVFIEYLVVGCEFLNLIGSITVLYLLRKNSCTQDCKCDFS